MIHFDLSKMTKEIEELEEKTSDQQFWDDTARSQKILQRIKVLKTKLEKYETLKSQWNDIKTLNELGIEEQDESVIAELEDEINEFNKKIDELIIETLFSEKYDSNNVILTLHAGAVGTEAQDWVQMLLRMYTRWAEKKEYTVKTLDFIDGDAAGIKSVTIMISGENAYGFMRSEKGVHRLVRISPFDASGRRHTSFASLDVMPEIDDSIEVDINPADLRIDVYRASGAGGQHVNKTSSAVRITHVPTGVVTSCQTERSQHQNKDYAMKMLRAKLVALKEQEHLDKIEDLKGLQLDIAWGSQIRSYVFCPYTLVKDHRTNHEEGNVNGVMDGEIDGFIKAYLTSQAIKKVSDK